MKRFIRKAMLGLVLGLTLGGLVGASSVQADDRDAVKHDVGPTTVATGTDPTEAAVLTAARLQEDDATERDAPDEGEVREFRDDRHDGERGDLDGRNREDWRYRWYNGRWWYWHPSNRWMYWSGNRWQYHVPGQAFRGTPRYYYYAPGQPYYQQGQRSYDFYRGSPYGGYGRNYYYYGRPDPRGFYNTPPYYWGNRGMSGRGGIRFRF